MRRLSRGRWVVILAAAFGAAGNAYAQVQRTWSNSGGGSFTDGSNWSGGTVPGSQDTAVFSLQSTYTVSFPTSRTTAGAQVNGGTVQFDFGSSGTPRTYTAGAVRVGGSARPTLTLRNGTLSANTLRVHDNSLLNVGPTSGFNNPPARLNVSGLLRIESGGRIDIRSGTSGGANHTLNANGDVLIDGGTLQRIGAGSFNLAAGRTITVRNGGQFNHGSTFELRQGSTLHGQSGASITFGHLDVAASGGNGTLLLEGAGSSLSANFPSFQFNESHRWGAAGNTALVEIRGGATAAIKGGLLLASDGSAAVSTLTLDGAGTRFQQTNVGAGGAPDQIVIGHASAGAATINLRNGALFTADAGTTGNSRVILNTTGRLNIESGATFAASFIQRNGGQVNMAGGNLRFDTFSGNLVNQAGTVIPGYEPDSNFAFIDGNYTQQPGASLQIGISGVLSGQTQQLGVAGNAILGGTLDLTLLDDFVPVPGNSFLVLQTHLGNIGGRFDTIEGTLPLPGVGLAVTYSQKQVNVHAAIPGDANLDGVVNLTDFNRLAANFGQSRRSWIEGDFTGDGVVNLADFNRLAANFGLRASSPDGPTPDDWSALAAAVPEPSFAALLGVPASAGMLRRRRKNRR